MLEVNVASVNVNVYVLECFLGGATLRLSMSVSMDWGVNVVSEHVDVYVFRGVNVASVHVHV